MEDTNDEYVDVDVNAWRKMMKLMFLTAALEYGDRSSKTVRPGRRSSVKQATYCKEDNEVDVANSCRRLLLR